MTTDTTALQERIRAEIIRSECGDNPVPLFVHERSDRLATAVLPIIAAEAQAASEKAWDEGYEAGMLDTYRLGRDMDLTITPAPNPYRETGDRA